VEEQNELNGQMDEVINGSRFARASLGSARYDNPIRQESLGGAVPFDTALNRLHQQIMKSESFYQKFKTEYDSDIMNIVKYAKEKTLVDIWAQKVKGNNHNHPQAASGQSGSNDELIEMADKFQITREKLQVALANASGSTMDKTTERGRSGTIRDDSARRSKVWVRAAQSQLPALLDLVTKTPEHCDELLKE
jgi:hypothetical protein